MPAIQPDSIAAGSATAGPATADSVAADSTEAAELWGLTLEAPPAPGRVEGSLPEQGTSWILLLVMTLVCILCFRIRRNTRFLQYLLKELFETRNRTNMFDDTVRETSFLALLDSLAALCGGILLSTAIADGLPALGIPPVAGAATLAGTAICTGAVSCLLLFLWGSYTVWGRTFMSPAVTRHWTRGFSIATGFLAILWLPVALFCCVQPQWAPQALILAAILFIMDKIIFIWKSLRIFTTEISSWTVFLYYLCGLEIVPLVLTFAAATFLCGKI